MVSKKTVLHSLLTIIMAVALSAAFSFVFPSIPLGGTAAAADHITLTWTGNPQTTQTVTWKTEVTPAAGFVQYALASEVKAFPYNAKTSLAVVEELSTNVGNVSIHSVMLTGLTPGAQYNYRSGDGRNWSELHTFTTEAVNSSGFKFLVFGDSQSINYTTWRDTIHQAYQANPDAAFFTNVGDLVDVGQDYNQWKVWFEAAQGVVDTIPVMPVTGNHENYTPLRRFSMPLFFTAQLQLPMNGPEGLQGQAYSFDYGDVHFAMLDSQEGEERHAVPAMLDIQKSWLENDLASTHKKWKVVVLHRSPYDNKESRGNGNIRGAFVPILDKYHADVVFTGHDHVYARTYPLHGSAVVDSPAKGTIYVATGRSGTKTYSNSIRNDWNEFFHNPLDEPNYLTVEVKGDIMTLKAFKQSGILIDNWTINKGSQ